MKRSAFIFATIMLIVLVSLIVFYMSRQGQEQFLPGIDIPMSKMNTKMRLEDPTYTFTGQMTGGLMINLINMTDQPIVLPDDYGLHYFTQQDDQWIVVPQPVSYGHNEKIVAPKDELPGGITIWAMPNIRAKQPTLIRIVVIGTIQKYRNNIFAETQIGAYIDIIFLPEPVSDNVIKYVKIEILILR
jgi:hypothetical protein